jgi:hypothetical protein
MGGGVTPAARAEHAATDVYGVGGVDPGTL